MNIQTSLDKIENIEFKAYFVVVSGSHVFRLALDNHPDVKELLESLSLTPVNADKVFRRALTLLNTFHDPAHYHPHDIAITAYAYVLHKASPVLARQVVDQIVDQPNMWWSRRIAEFVLAEANPQTVQND